jgi:hypothetical protein
MVLISASAATLSLAPVLCFFSGQTKFFKLCALLFDHNFLPNWAQKRQTITMPQPECSSARLVTLSSLNFTSHNVSGLGHSVKKFLAIMYECPLV